ncbi:MAG: alpha/beta fold hydrolase [Candidatus Cloacimonetes bacterium]|nr:alpha/beta fold hydrolase [Candidatus Cloacimonadota bacterium]
MKEMNFEDYMDEIWKTPQRLNNIHKIMKGDFEPTPAQTPSRVVKEFGRVKLLAYYPKGEVTQSPVLMVPSIINKYYVFDLAPNQSMVEYLCDQGIPVYMIDWGIPGPQDKYTTFEDHIIRWQGACLRAACKDFGVEKMHLLGYCVGGTMATIYAALKPKRVAGLIALTAPINFHDDGLLSSWASSDQLDVRKLSEAWGNIPADFLEESFALLMPTAKMKKYMNLYENAHKDSFLKKHYALDGWLNDNVGFPGATYEEYVKKCYVNNDLMNNEFILGDMRVDLKNIKCPLLVLTAKHDHIVPDQSATVLAEMVGSEDITSEQFRAGHIGITVGSKAKDTMWKTVQAWLKDRVVE